MKATEHLRGWQFVGVEIAKKVVNLKRLGLILVMGACIKVHYAISHSQRGIFWLKLAIGLMSESDPGFRILTRV